MYNPEQYEYGEKQTFMGRYGFVIGICVVALVGVGLFKQAFSGHSGPPPLKRQDVVMIKTAPPPTPPPQPPTPPPPQLEQKQQMIEQTPLEDEAKPEPVDQSPSLGTNIQGSGAPDAFGLSGHGNGMLGGGTGGRSGSRFGWYANEVVSSVGDALRQNPHTRSANFNVKVRIWSDDTGRVVRVKLAGTTGDAGVDDAIQNEVLKGFQLKEPPPDGMPMPIVMRLSARRPD